MEDVLGRVKAEFEERRNTASNERKARMEAVRLNYPRIREIDDEIFKLGVENMHVIALDPSNAEMYNKQLKAKYDILNKEKKDIIRKNKIDPFYDTYKYKCSICSDTGYTPMGARCNCFKQEVINGVFDMYDTIRSMQYENFNNFSYEYYSEVNGSKEFTERENMVRIVRRAIQLCSNFDNEEKGLFLMGEPGLGKTFLSKCIAKELMSKGKTVIYVRAGKLFKMLEDEKFGRDVSGYKTDYIYSSDLLIIDDLGTESRSSVNTSFLDTVINTRIDAKKKMVINTNLFLEELHKTYSKRLTSRIIDSFILCRFYGSDIRMQKLEK